MTDTATVQPKKKPLMSRIPANFVAAVLKGHSGLGIAFAAAIYLVCLSGSITVFYEDISRWENASAPYVESVTPQAAQHAMEQAADRAGDGLEHINLFMPDETEPLFRVSVDLADGAPSKIWFADENGDLQVDARYNLSSFIYELHALLHLPSSFGGFVVGMTGVALLSSLFSGILAHPRIFRDAFHLRLGGSKRLQEADVHNRISVWALPFHFIVSLTGAFLGLSPNNRCPNAFPTRCRPPFIAPASKPDIDPANRKIGQADAQYSIDNFYKVSAEPAIMERANRADHLFTHIEVCWRLREHLLTGSVIRKCR